MKEKIKIIGYLLFGLINQVKLQDVYEKITLRQSDVANYQEHKKQVLKTNDLIYPIGNIEEIKLTKNPNEKCRIITEQNITKNTEILYDEKYIMDNNETIFYRSIKKFGKVEKGVFVNFLSPYSLNLDQKSENIFTSFMIDTKRIRKVRIEKSTDVQIIDKAPYLDFYGNEGLIVAVNPEPFNGTVAIFHGKVKVDKFEQTSTIKDKIVEWYIPLDSKDTITSVGNIGGYTSLIRCNKTFCDFYYAEILGGNLYVGYLYSLDEEDKSFERIYNGYGHEYVYFLSHLESGKFEIYAMKFNYRGNELVKVEFPESLEKFGVENFEIYVSGYGANKTYFYSRGRNEIYFLEKGNIRDFIFLDLSKFIEHSNFGIKSLSSSHGYLNIVVEDYQEKKDLFISLNNPVDLTNTLRKFNYFSRIYEKCEISSISLKTKGIPLKPVYPSFMVYCSSKIETETRLFVLNEFPLIYKKIEENKNYVMDNDEFDYFDLEIEYSNRNHKALSTLKFYGLKDSVKGIVETNTNFTKGVLKKRGDYKLSSIFNFSNRQFPIEVKPKLINLEKSKLTNPEDVIRIKSYFKKSVFGDMANEIGRDGEAYFKLNINRFTKEFGYKFYYKDEEIDYEVKNKLIVIGPNYAHYYPRGKLHLIEEKMICFSYYMVPWENGRGMRDKLDFWINCYNFETNRQTFEKKVRVNYDTSKKNSPLYSFFKYTNKNKFLIKMSFKHFIIDGDKVNESQDEIDSTASLKDDDKIIFFDISADRKSLVAFEFNQTSDEFKKPIYLKFNEEVLSRRDHRIILCQEFTDKRKFTYMGRCSIIPYYGGMGIIVDVNKNLEQEDTIKIENKLFLSKGFDQIYLNCYNDYLVIRTRKANMASSINNYYYDLRIKNRILPTEFYILNNPKIDFILLKKSGFYDKNGERKEKEEFSVASYAYTSFVLYNNINLEPDVERELKLRDIVEMNYELKNLQIEFIFLDDINGGQTTRSINFGIDDIFEFNNTLKYLYYWREVIGFLMIFGLPYGFKKWKEYIEKKNRCFREGYWIEKKIKDK